MVLFTPSNGHELSRKARTAKLSLMLRKANIPLAGLLNRKDPLYAVRADLMKLGKIAVFVSDNIVRSNGKEKFNKFTWQIKSLIDECDEISSQSGITRKEKLQDLSAKTYEVASHMLSLYPDPIDFGYQSRWSVTPTLPPKTQRLERKRVDLLSDLKSVVQTYEPTNLLASIRPLASVARN